MYTGFINFFFSSVHYLTMVHNMMMFWEHFLNGVGEIFSNNS